MFSFLDIFFIKKEVEILKQSRLEKIFEGKDFLFIQFSKDKKYYLKYIFGRALFLSDKEKNKSYFIEKKEKTKNLEKIIERSIVKDILIYPGERIINFKLSKFNKTLNLFFVLYGKGNVVVFEDDKEIFNYTGEKIKIEKRFSLNKKNLLDLLNEEKIKILPIKNFISNFLGFGKYYFNEFINEFNFDYDKHIKDLKNREKELLIENILRFINKKLNPILTEKRPFPIFMKTLKVISYENSFSEALDKFFKPKDKYQIKKEEIEKSIKKIEKYIEELNQEKKIIEEKINILNNYYPFFEELQFYYKKAKEEKKLEDFFKKLENIGVKVNKKDRCIKISILKIKELFSQ